MAIARPILLGSSASGAASEEDPSRRPDELGAGAQHRRGDHKGGDRVGAVKAGQQDDGGGEGGADRGVGVDEVVLEGALDVEALAIGLGQRERGGEVDGNAGDADGEHQLCFDLWRVDDPADALVDDEAGEDDQRQTVGLGGEWRR